MSLLLPPLGIIRQAIKAAWDDIREGLYLAALLVGVYFVVAYLFPDDWRIKWSLRHFVDSNKVTIERRPTLCDWGGPPLGNKGCHYERVFRER